MREGADDWETVVDTEPPDPETLESLAESNASQGYIAVAIFLFIGLFFTPIGMSMRHSANKYEALERVGVSTQGEVVALKRSGKATVAVVRFTTKEGRAIEQVLDGAIPHRLRKKGEAVKVLYDPGRPRHARYHDHSWGAGRSRRMAALMFIMSGVFCMFSLFGVFVVRGERAQKLAEARGGGHGEA